MVPCHIYLAEINKLGHTPKILNTKTNWVDNKNATMKFPKTLAWTKDDGTECASSYIRVSSDRPATNYDGAEYSRFLYGMGQDNHEPLHASALSVQQPFNKMGDGPKRRASDTAPSNQDLEIAQVDLEDHTRRVGGQRNDRRRSF